MARENFNELLAFVTVAREGSFTRAAKAMGVSQSALSHTIRALETRFDLRLLTRTTRSVSPTEAGDRLLATLTPRFADIEAALLDITTRHAGPAGLLRIGASAHAASTILLPALARLLPQYPDLKVALQSDGDDHSDATVRLGEHLARDMSATRIGPDVRMAVVGTPAYFARTPAPSTPQELPLHQCITKAGWPAWDFARDGVPVNVRVEGQVVVASLAQLRIAALAGLGLAWVLEDVVQDDVAAGRLVRVLDAWCSPFAGYYLHYPTRREGTAALGLLVDALRVA
jgi:DNA-binding transcriptional LysR family regulator